MFKAFAIRYVLSFSTSLSLECSCITPAVESLGGIKAGIGDGAAVVVTVAARFLIRETMASSCLRRSSIRS